LLFKKRIKLLIVFFYRICSLYNIKNKIIVIFDSNMIKSFNLLYCILILFSLNKSIYAWIEWDYLTYWSQKTNDGGRFTGSNFDLESRDTAIASWEGIWKDPAPMYENDNKAPRPRRGHSIVVANTPSNVPVYDGYTYLLMFAGRDNSKLVEHIPKSYNVEKVNGTMMFTTYDDKPLNPCLDKDNLYYSVEQQAGCKCLPDDLDCVDGTYDADYGMSEVAVIYNDVWAYRMCDREPPECSIAETNGVARPGRCFNTPCEDSGWVILHPGALEGGCVIQLGILVCNVPSERYSHSASMFEDGTMYVYGGFSQRCQDFCDDVWMFDIFIKGWRQLYASGTTYDITKLVGDIITINNNPVYVKYTEEEIPVDRTSVVPNSDENAEPIYRLWAGPGKRWRHTMVIGSIFQTEEIMATGAIEQNDRQKVAIFGGHRLWHGYSPENSEKNSWQYADTRPLGGYLDDLWMYTKRLDRDTFPGETFMGSEGRWKKIKAKKICFTDPGISWESRFDVSCTITWPMHRAGHGSAFDFNRNLIWIYGGYHTYYPYLSTDSSGSSLGVSQAGTGGFVPYPAYNYFLDDLWYYNITDGYWTEVGYPPDMPAKPDGRMDMIFLLINKGTSPEDVISDILFLHGGYADNYLYDDTWYYNITSGRWLEKHRHTDAIYADSCTDDVDYIKHHPECELADWSLHLERDDIFPFHVKPYVDQDKYWPDPEYTPYWDIIAKGAEFDVLNDHATEGTAMWPNAATGPNQYAQKVVPGQDEEGFNISVYERCTSVFAEPTRGHLVDGYFGRSNGSVFIPQRRNRRQGWDGCRDRFDGRTDLPQQLQYFIPTPRALHRGVYLPLTNEILIYGGMAYYTPMPKSLSSTYPVYVKDDMWYYNFDQCLENCTGNGDCYFGFCQCYVGYYGEDCSNSSCPGTSCFYDEFTHDQTCTHGCQAAYEHTDEDIYVQDLSKIPCTREYWGESNGICDGYGTTQCVPPFIGDDCSIKDCKNNCSFNGWCSVEFPVSRCMCQPGYFGDICEHKICLNNCSYPNGVCNITSAQCECRMMYNPYNSTQEYHPWAGEDCSYLPAYSAGNYAYIDSKVYYIMIFVFTSLFFIDIV
jgi:hypothetical protein